MSNTGRSRNLFSILICWVSCSPFYAHVVWLWVKQQLDLMRDTELARNAGTTRILECQLERHDGWLSSTGLYCLSFPLLSSGSGDVMCDCRPWRTPGGTWLTARCHQLGPALHDFAIVPQMLWGFSLCAEDYVSADVLISDKGSLSGRRSLIWPRA